MDQDSLRLKQAKNTKNNKEKTPWTYRFPNLEVIARHCGCDNDGQGGGGWELHLEPRQNHTHGVGNSEGGNSQERCPLVSHWVPNSALRSWSTAGTATHQLNMWLYLTACLFPLTFPNIFSLPAWERNNLLSVALEPSRLANWTLAADIPKWLCH